MLDLVYGASWLTPTPRSLGNPTSVFLAQVLPLPVWGWLWLVVGAVCLVHAFRFRDGVGFAVAMALKVLWGAVFLLGWLFADVERGYLSAAVWLAFAALIGLVATWPDDLKRVTWGGEDKGR